MLIRIPETLFAAHAATLEEVLRLSGAARRHPDAALYFADGRYVMVYRASGSAPAVRFVPFPDEYLLHLEEHGKCLIPADAGNFLIRTFFRRSPSFY